MTPKQEAALRQALEALEWNLPVIEDYGDKEQLNRQHKSIAAIYEALAEQPAQQQEPFGYFRYDLRLDAWVQNREGRPGTPFYTSPPASKPLTDAQIGAVAADIWGSILIAPQSYQAFARAIEAAHGITGETK